MALIEFSDRGLYCPPANVYIDPWKSVDKAIITHAHSDHAKNGNGHYLCHPYTTAILKARLGENNYQSIEWNEVITINGVKISLHPAGHIIGSSQVKLEYKNEIWVFSGDYKVENDGISGSFEPVRCNTFITESTFALPIYKWLPQKVVYENIQQWIKQNQQEQVSSVLIAYSLGKAQRLLQPLSEVTETIFVHGAVWNMHQALINAGIHLPEVELITPLTPKEKLKGCVVIAPSGSESSPWINRFKPYEVGICSGWMQVRGNTRRSNADKGFVLSDHADWNGLLTAIKDTGAQKVFATHGFQSAFSRYLNEQGIEAAEVKTEYGDEDETIVEPNPLP
ncbi:ligase-associated DNA damage response exonuclease [Ferruginibacter albus]|uniref:ligase-associated DNA damage response exonuclease n=1 Tax=Ferruginibacter albus TaxID=2875540 RepID=UPI001CC4D9B5|nr:ligase-associated DNA damage response exonuclease [Ferruginibacter albus]UAY51227.1 ligase-associated DNA damage response exonuclease [Ferruginibacter albus]